MGKTKKKNPGKGIDFKKVRTKVGKKLPKAQNVTDTTIRSRAINLPGQNLRDQEETEASGAVVSSRNLNLKELLAQTGHYSEKVRRDAIMGLREILSAHPQEVRKAPQEVLERLAARMTDADSQVRKGLAALLRDVVLPALDGCDGAAFLPMVMAHLSSAMTHIADPIRNDSLPMLEVIMGWVPGEIVDGYLSPCLAQFSHLLSHGQRGKSVQSQSIASLYKAAVSLHGFLKSAAKADTDRLASQAQHADPATHQGALFAHRSRWAPRSLVPRVREPRCREADVLEEGEEACRSLLQRLMECLMECAPGHMAVQPEEAAVQCMAEILGCINLILGRLKGSLRVVTLELAVGKKGKKQPVTAEEAFLKLLAPHFPAAMPAEPPPPDGLKVALSTVNIRSAQLLQRLLPRPEGVEGEEPWVGRLVQYWVAVCHKGHVLACTDAQRTFAVQPPESSGISEQASAAALSGFREVLFHIPAHHRATLVAAVGDLADRSPSRSSSRLRCLQFQQELLAKAAAIPGGLAGAGMAADGATAAKEEAELISEDEAIRWLNPLPRLLWELGASAPAASEAALELLLLIGRLATPDGRLSGFLDELQAQLLPLYMVTRAKKPSKAGAAPEATASPGPLAELPARCQNLALDLLWYFPSLSEATLRSIALMSLSILGRAGKRSASYPPALGLRAAEIIIARCQHGTGQHHACAAVEPKAYLSFILSLLLGSIGSLRPSEFWVSVLEDSSKIEQPEISQRRQRFWAAHTKLAKLASETIASTPAPCKGGLLGLLAPAIIRELGDGSSCLATGGARAWFGLLAVAAAAEGSAGLPDELGPILPEAVIMYTMECSSEQGDIDRPISDNHPGMSACIKLFAAIPSLLGPCLAALQEAAQPAASDARLPNVFKARQPHSTTAAARLVAALCSCIALREGLLDHTAELRQVTATLREVAAGYGGASEHGAAAVAASLQAGMLVDTMLGSL